MWLINYTSTTTDAPSASWVIRPRNKLPFATSIVLFSVPLRIPARAWPRKGTPAGIWPCVGENPGIPWVSMKSGQPLDHFYSTIALGLRAVPPPPRFPTLYSQARLFQSVSRDTVSAGRPDKRLGLGLRSQGKILGHGSCDARGAIS